MSDPEQIPSYYARYICFQCGRTEVIDVDVSQFSWQSRAVREIHGKHKVPSGWQQIGMHIYCQQHKIEIVNQIRVDGVITEQAHPLGGES